MPVTLRNWLAVGRNTSRAATDHFEAAQPIAIIGVFLIASEGIAYSLPLDTGQNGASGCYGEEVASKQELARRDKNHGAHWAKAQRRCGEVHSAGMGLCCCMRLS